MNAEKWDAVEIVQALRKACHGCDPTPCCEYEVLGGDAAAMIESLQAQLAESQHRERAAEAAVGRMAEYIVTIGRVDYYLCDEIPRELHLKYQPKDDGSYANAPCIKCVAEYYMQGPHEAGEVHNG